MKVTLSNLIAYIGSKYKHSDDIFIVGKGASVDQLDLDHLSEGLVVNINDSECILPGDVCLFRKPWVLDGLRQSGFQCNYYVAPQDLEIPGVAFMPAHSIPDREESGELALYRFLSDTFELENVLLVSAIKLARLIGAHKKRVQRTLLLGFDFRIVDRPYSRRVLYDYSEHTGEFKQSVIWLQEKYLIDLLSLAQQRRIDWIEITHIGSLPYSRMTCEQFNCNFRHRAVTRSVMPMVRSECSTGRTKRASERRVKIVAEFTNNHLGDIERLRRMVRRSAEAGADLVKVQKRDVDTFYSADQLSSPYISPFGKTLRHYRRGVELTREGFEALDEECRRCSIDWFCSVLDYHSYRFLRQFGPRLLKLPSTVSERRDFLRQVASEHQGDLVVSTGFTNAEYEEFVLRHFSGCSQIYLLQTNSAYPTAPFECGVAIIRHYRDLSRQDPRIIPGYSSHDLGSLASMLAVAAGARMVEKHVKLGDTSWVHFDHVAVDLELDDFDSYVKDIRMAEDICGEESKQIHFREHHKYHAVELSR